MTLGDDEGQEREIRATKYSVDGSMEDVSDKVEGGRSFLDAWQQAPDMPQEFETSGWQGPDEEHPAGSGVPGYRVVYKTLRIVPFPAVTMSWPNLRVVMQNGDISRGGVYAPTAVPARARGHFVIPEFGRVFSSGAEGIRYIPGINMLAEIQAWEDSVKAACHIEIITHIDSADGYQAMVAAGRRRVAALKTLLDLKFGPRLLAMPMTEEVGETFPDWHWNRKLSTGLVSLESQAKLRTLERGATENELVPLLQYHQDLSIEEGRRITLASRWYWKADEDDDSTTRFISWWLVIESLEMVDTTNIRPVRERLSVLFENQESDWSSLVGQLYGLRSRVVHGNEWEVPAERLRQVEVVARSLLCSRLLREIPDDLRIELLSYL